MFRSSVNFLLHLYFLLMAFCIFFSDFCFDVFSLSGCDKHYAQRISRILFPWLSFLIIDVYLHAQRVLIRVIFQFLYIFSGDVVTPLVTQLWLM